MTSLCNEDLMTMTVFKVGDGVSDIPVPVLEPSEGTSHDDSSETDELSEAADVFLSPLTAHLDYCKAFIDSNVDRWRLRAPDDDGY